ncbi:hypothetical protein TNCV_654121 [Trichonephila clavipes]|nr:hypothetical protein TNCV_654121 [Trichonephila clavipes]
MANIYKNTITEIIKKSLNVSLFNGKDWTTQQDTAPVHKRTINVNFVYYYIPKQRRLVSFRSSGLNNFSAEAYYSPPIQHVTFLAHFVISAIPVLTSKHEKGKGRREDLFVLATELNLEFDKSMTIATLKDLIIGSENYDEELTKNKHSTIVEDRKAREENLRIEKSKKKNYALKNEKKIYALKNKKKNYALKNEKKNYASNN